MPYSIYQKKHIKKRQKNCYMLIIDFNNICTYIHFIRGVRASRVRPQLGLPTLVLCLHPYPIFFLRGVLLYHKNLDRFGIDWYGYSRTKSLSAPMHMEP